VWFLSPLLVALVAVGTIQAQDDVTSKLDDVLNVLALSRSDLAISKDYLPDPDRLAVTRRLMSDPVSSEAWLSGLAHSLQRGNDVETVEIAGRLFNGSGDGRFLRQSHGSVQVDLVTRVERAGSLVRDLLETASVRRDLIGLVHPDTALQAAAQDDLVAAGREIPVLELLEVAADLIKHALEAESSVGEPWIYDSPFGRVTIGGMGDDVYDVPHALIIDPGGNDIYRGVAGVSSVSVPVSVVVDLDGDDRYQGAAATGRQGIGVLVDVSGNDTYLGDDATQGAGIGGIGILIDKNGNDTYRAAVGAQGFGLYGVGILIDQSGNDTFACDLMGQGSAAPGGVGLLLDREGDDTYRAGGPYKDFREDGVYAKSMSQGFSLGLQTEASGGAGLLIDLTGGDRYEVSYFGQGASHWAGTGGLYDGAGDDVYTARRYAQGCGLHLSAGILVDDSGDDVYSMWGVGQGCGHDLAVGVLWDRAGDDRYEISWLGQGAGSGNGTGLLIDCSGDDTYSAGREDTQGFGEPARGFGSIGILLDLFGDDRYRDADTRRLVKSGTTGGRYDVPEDREP